MHHEANDYYSPRMTSRRRFLQMCSLLPLLAGVPRSGNAQDGHHLAKLKAGYAKRLKKILAKGALPYIDIESSCNAVDVDIEFVAANMDRLNIGLMALSADIGKDMFNRGARFDDLSERLLAAYPDRFIPVGNGGQAPVFTEAPEEFLTTQENAARRKDILLFGEFEFRHYPSLEQITGGESRRDSWTHIDGALGHRVFSLAERTGLPVQIHYEIEDDLLAPLESMLLKYPKARVIWCHLAQIRYQERSTLYSPTYVENLIRRFPNIYFDTAFGDYTSVYPLSNQRHARVWADDGSLRTIWRRLIMAYPQRFLSALDLNGDNINRMAEHDAQHRAFLRRLPEQTRHHVAYRSAWSLLFGEEFA